MLRRALGGEGERSKWTREATHKAQSTLALGRRRNYPGSHDRSEHRGTHTLALCRRHGGRTQRLHWPFHFLKQGDLEGSLGLSHHDPWGNTVRLWKSVLCLEGKWGWSAFPRTAPFNDHPLPEGQMSWNAGFDQCQTFVPRVQQKGVKTREWRGFGMDPGPGVGRGWAGGGGRQGSSMSWWDRAVEVPKQVKSMHSQWEIWEGILAEGAFTRMSDKKQESWLCALWRASQAALVVKNLWTQETEQTRLQSLGREDPLEKRMATHSRTLAWRIPCTEEPGGLRSVGSQSVEHDWIDLGCTQCKMYLMCRISSFLVQFPLGCHGWISSSGVSSL